MSIQQLFEELQTKDIICWGSGKHFRNITYERWISKSAKDAMENRYKEIERFLSNRKTH